MNEKMFNLNCPFLKSKSIKISTSSYEQLSSNKSLLNSFIDIIDYGLNLKDDSVCLCLYFLKFCSIFS